MNTLKKINKAIICFLLFAILSSTVFGQEEAASRKFAHEFNLEYGAPRSLVIASIPMLSTILVAPVSGGKLLTPKGPGVFQAGYSWYPLDWLSVGLTGTFEPFALVMEGDDPKAASDYSLLWSIQAKVGFHYGWEYVRLYHSLSAGVGVLGDGSSADPESGTPAVIPAFNIVPIGVEVGKNEGFYGFADLSLGMNAFFNIGAGYRFVP